MRNHSLHRLNAARLILDLRKSGISDTRILQAFEKTPRELFVPEPFQDRAYENAAFPIGHGQTISQPLVVAFMIQMLEVGDRHRILEIGTGSGYQSVILSYLCRRVYTIERIRGLMQDADKNFKVLARHNITTRIGDGSKGWPEQAPFERIVVSAGAIEPPQKLLDQLAPGGIMVIPIGDPLGAQHIIRYKKDEHDSQNVTEDRLWPVRFVPLVIDSDQKKNT
jgi:protein-L-isoaspartate(D-aspartate) O-methyltransferase